MIFITDQVEAEQEDVQRGSGEVQQLVSSTERLSSNSIRVGAAAVHHRIRSRTHYVVHGMYWIVCLPSRWVVGD